MRLLKNNMNQNILISTFFLVVLTACATPTTKQASSERQPSAQTNSDSRMGCTVNSDGGTKDIEIGDQTVKAEWGDLDGHVVYPARFLSGPRFDSSGRMAYYMDVLAQRNFPQARCLDGYCASGFQGYVKVYGKATLTPELSGPVVCIKINRGN